jgi:MYXO-CTERM domain-containing protein
VAVIPGKDEAGNNPTFSVSFKKPADDALTSVGGTSGSSGNEFAPSPEPAPEFTAQPSYNAPPPVFEPDAPDAPITGPASSSDRGGTGTGVASPVVGSRTDSESSSSGWRIAGFGLLALTALAYHRLSTTPDRAPRSLVTFGQLASEEQAQG